MIKLQLVLSDSYLFSSRAWNELVKERQASQCSLVPNFVRHVTVPMKHQDESRNSPRDTGI